MGKRIKVTNPKKPKELESESVTIDWMRPQDEIARIKDLYAAAYLETLVEELPRAHKAALDDVKAAARAVLTASLGLRNSFGSWEFVGSDNPLKSVVASKATAAIVAEIEKWLADGTALEVARLAQKSALEEYKRVYKDACMRGMRDLAHTQAPKDMAALTQGGIAIPRIGEEP